MNTPSSTPNSLTDATIELRAGLRAQLGDVLDPFDDDADQLAVSTLGAAAPGVGDVAPEFELPDARGGDLSLASALASGPVVLIFYRGAWCPYCNLQLKAFQHALPELTAAGASLIAVSPQTPDASMSFAEQAELEFAVLSDEGNRVARSYGLVFRQAEAPTQAQLALGIDLRQVNGDDSFELPVPAVFVIQPDGVISLASVSPDYRWRIGPDEVLAALTA